MNDLCEVWLCEVWSVEFDAIPKTSEGAAPELGVGGGTEMSFGGREELGMPAGGRVVEGPWP